MAIEYAKRMDAFGISIIKELFKLAVDPEIISLAGGAPAPEVYPIDDFAKASAAAFEEHGSSIMAYDMTAGYPPLRDIIAKERMKAVGVETTVDNILITTGSQQGIDIAGKLFLDEGDVVVVESPTYLAALNTFSSYQANYAEVAMDEDGIIMEDLENILKTTPKVKLIYVNPDFQNPSGRTLSLDRRKRLVALAEEYNVPIVEDNPYIEKMIPVYKGRRDAMIDTMETEFPDNVSFTRPQGGFFSWVTVSENIDTVDLFKKALVEKVAFVPGATCFAKEGHDNHMRLSYSQMT